MRGPNFSSVKMYKANGKGGFGFRFTPGSQSGTQRDGTDI